MQKCLLTWRLKFGLEFFVSAFMIRYQDRGPSMTYLTSSIPNFPTISLDKGVLGSSIAGGVDDGEMVWAICLDIEMYICSCIFICSNDIN